MEGKPGVFIDSLSSAARKEVAVSRGLFAYFPDALALIARHSVLMNEKHNPGQPVHWSRAKSSDHEDCIGRHSLSIAIDPNSLDDGQPHVICRAWRALAALQVWAETQAAHGWIPWSGGPCPVDRDTPVRTRLRDGFTSSDATSAGYLDWKHHNGQFDIIAYKVA
jgi:hypothetical protein